MGKSKKIDEKIVKLLTKQCQKSTVEELHSSIKSRESSALKLRPKSSTSKHKQKLRATAERVRVMNETTKMLGKMNEDVVFLEKFVKSQNWRQKTEDADGFVNTTASDALQFLKDRKHFWEQTIVTET